MCKGNLTMESSIKEPDLLACIAPVLKQVMPLKQKNGVETDLDSFRIELLSAFDAFESACYSEQITASTMQEAKFALTALVDESVMTSDRDFKFDWMSRPLQLEFFGNNRAGEEFFERMDNLRKAGESKLDLLEVYFVCLQIGFEGVYKVKGLEQLKSLVIDIRAQIEDYRGPVPTQLSENGLPQEGFAMKVGRNVPYWVILAVCLSVIVLLFVGFQFVLNKSTNSSNLNLEKNIAVLTELDKTGMQ